MDLTRTLQVKIDPSGAVAGGNAAANAFKTVGTSATDMDKSIRNATGGMEKMGSGNGGGAMGGVAKAAGGLKAAFGALSGAVAAMGLAVFTKQLIETQIQMDKIGNTLRFSTGGAKEGGEAFAWLQMKSKELGLEFTSTATSFSKFAAATKGTAIDFQETQRIFVAVSKASTVLGLSADESAGALNALQQMVSKGTVQAEELRGQLGERIPGAFNLAARSMGVTTQQLGKMLDEGKVMAADLLPKLARELEKTFGPETAKSAQSLQAEMNRLSNSWKNFQTTVLSGGVGDFLKDMVKSLREAVEWVERGYKGARLPFNSSMNEKPEPTWGRKPTFDPNILDRFSYLGSWSTTPLKQPMQLNPFRYSGTAYENIPPELQGRLAEIATWGQPGKQGGIRGKPGMKVDRTSMGAFQQGMFDSRDENSFSKLLDPLEEKLLRMREVGRQTVNALSTGFEGFFRDLASGTMSAAAAFKNMAKSMLQDIAAIISKTLIAQPLANAIAGAFGKSMFMPASVPVPKSHTGSLVGVFGGTSTQVNPAIFAGAPRFHSGLAPDEFPAILQKGEAVIPKSQVGRMGAGGGGVNVNVTVNMESSGNAANDGQNVGSEVARQVENMVRSILVRETRPRGLLHA